MNLFMTGLHLRTVVVMTAPPPLSQGAAGVAVRGGMTTEDMVETPSPPPMAKLIHMAE